MEKPGGPQKRPGFAAGRAAKWQDPTKRQMFRMPDVPRATVYTSVSLALLAGLGAILFYDFIMIVAVQHPDATTQHFTVAILVSANEIRRMLLCPVHTDVELSRVGRCVGAYLPVGNRDPVSSSSTKSVVN